MDKLDLNEIIGGALVGDIFERTVKFKHNKKECSVDIRIKQLPFAVTEPLFRRLNKGDDVVAEWIAAALVNDDGENYLNKKQVAAKFTQSLTKAVFDEILEIGKAQEPDVDDEGKPE